MAKYRKKPIVIDAVQWQEKTIMVPPGPEWFYEAECKGIIILSGKYLLIETPEGTMRADPGDWVLRGAAGEIYPCKEHIFPLTYEEVKEWQ